MNGPSGPVALPGAAGTTSEAPMARTLDKPPVTLTGAPDGSPAGSPLAAVPGAVAADSPAEAVALLLRRLGYSAPQPLMNSPSGPVALPGAAGTTSEAAVARTLGKPAGDAGPIARRIPDRIASRRRSRSCRRRLPRRGRGAPPAPSRPFRARTPR